MAWKVAIHMPRVEGTVAWILSRISAAALLVKVMAKILQGATPKSPTRWAIRWVSTRVLPEPAPANTSKGPSVHRTASRCCTFRDDVSKAMGPPL